MRAVCVCLYVLYYYSRSDQSTNVSYIMSTSTSLQPQPQHVNLRLRTMSFTCSVCQGNFCSPAGLKKHMNSRHNKNSAVAGMAEASQLHTFIRHPNLSGMFKPVHNSSHKVLNTYHKPVHVHLMAHSFEILSHNPTSPSPSSAPILGSPSMTD